MAQLYVLIFPLPELTFFPHTLLPLPMGAALDDLLKQVTGEEGRA